MLGWWVLVNIGDLAEQDAGAKTPTVAKWETGPDGIRWLDKLVEEGRAVEVWKHGYPCRYKAKAADVLPLLTNGGITPPKNGLWVFGVDEGEEYAMPPGWMGQVDLDHEAMATCTPDQVLTIDAWDQS